MAFFRHSPSAGAVVRAEHVFVPRSSAAAAARPLARRWRRDADGRLVCDWADSADAAAPATEPPPAALAA